MDCSITAKKLQSLSIDILIKVDRMDANNQIISILKSSATMQSRWQSVSATLLVDKSFDAAAERCARELVQYVIKDDYVEGEVSRTQLYLEKLYLEKKAPVFKEAFQQAWVRLFTLDNSVHLYTFACIASCLPHEWLDSHGITLLLGCAIHENDMVNEACIRMAEAWEEPQYVAYLEKIRPFEASWLEQYRQETISFLKELG